MYKYLLFFLVVIAYSCKNNNVTDNTLSELTIGFVPSEEVERMVNNLKPVTNYLSKELDMPVKIFKGNDYTAVIEAMRSDKLDVGIFGPFSYILASNKAGAQALVSPATRNGKFSTYNSLIVTNKNTGLKSIDDLKNNPKKYSFSFSDPASTSGHLVPRGHMISLGIKPEEHFENIVFSGSHTATILSLANGKIDVAGCSENVFLKMIERGMLDTSKVSILWKSPNIPVDLVTVRKNISNDMKKRLIKAYTKMAYEAPETAHYFYEEWNDSTLVYQATHDTIYKNIRRLANFVNDDLNK